MKKRGRPVGTVKLNEALVDRFCEEIGKGVRLADAAGMAGVSVRSAYAWREKGRKLSVEFLDEIDEVPVEDRIYLHFLHSIEHAKSQCVVRLIGEANRLIKSTSDALKMLEYVCPEEFGPAARRRDFSEHSTFDLNLELCRIVASSHLPKETAGNGSAGTGIAAPIPSNVPETLLSGTKRKGLPLQ